MSGIETYWPEVIKEYKEFQELASAEDPEITALWQAIDDMLDDKFIATAMETGIARREKMLGLSPFADDDLESRRFRIQAKWIDKLPYTYPALINKLDNLCGDDGYVVSRDCSTHTLDIKIELTKSRMFDEVSKVARQMVPANFIVTVELRYNQHLKYTGYTHSQLSAYTHYQLRNEVI